MSISFWYFRFLVFRPKYATMDIAKSVRYWKKIYEIRKHRHIYPIRQNKWWMTGHCLQIVTPWLISALTIWIILMTRPSLGQVVHWSPCRVNKPVNTITTMKAPEVTTISMKAPEVTPISRSGDNRWRGAGVRGRTSPPEGEEPHRAPLGHSLTALPLKAILDLMTFTRELPVNSDNPIYLIAS